MYYPKFQNSGCGFFSQGLKFAENGLLYALQTSLKRRRILENFWKIKLLSPIYIRYLSLHENAYPQLMTIIRTNVHGYQPFLNTKSAQYESRGKELPTNFQDRFEALLTIVVSRPRSVGLSPQGDIKEWKRNILDIFRSLDLDLGS